MGLPYRVELSSCGELNHGLSWMVVWSSSCRVQWSCVTDFANLCKRFTTRGSQQEVHNKRFTTRGSQQEAHKKRIIPDEFTLTQFHASCITMKDVAGDFAAEALPSSSLCLSSWCRSCSSCSSMTTSPISTSFCIRLFRSDRFSPTTKALRLDVMLLQSDRVVATNWRDAVTVRSSGRSKYGAVCSMLRAWRNRMRQVKALRLLEI